RAAERADAVLEVEEPDAARLAGGEAASVVGDLEDDPARLLPDAHGHGRVGPGVLRGIVDRFQAAEVDGRLDVGCVPPARLDRDARRQGRAPCGGREDGLEALVPERGWVDAVRERAELLERALEVELEPGHDRVRARPVARSELACQAELER